MDEPRSQVVVVDIRMPFWSMVVFLVKLAIAAIPAFILLTFLGYVVAAVFSGVAAGLWTLKTTGAPVEARAAAAVAAPAPRPAPALRPL